MATSIKLEKFRHDVNKEDVEALKKCRTIHKRSATRCDNYLNEQLAKTCKELDGITLDHYLLKLLRDFF